MSLTGESDGSTSGLLAIITTFAPHSLISMRFKTLTLLTVSGWPTARRHNVFLNTSFLSKVYGLHDRLMLSDCSSASSRNRPLSGM